MKPRTTRNRLKWAGVAFGTALLAAFAAPLAAQAQPADPATAEATAAEVEPVAAIADTNATADSNSGEAQAHAVELGGEPPSEQFGGSTEGEGTDSGALIDTGETPLGQLQVTPWQATVTESETERTASSQAALARITVIDDQTLTASVLAAESEAHHTDGTSTGSSASDGARIRLGGDGGLELVILHAETTSTGGGSSYLVGVNDNKIVSSDQAGGQCLIEVPGLLTLECVAASGGQAAPASAAALDLVVGPAGELEVGIVTAGSEGDEGLLPLPEPPVEPPSVLPRVIEPEAAAPLARTGFDAADWALRGLALAAIGGLALVSRRRYAANPIS